MPDIVTPEVRSRMMSGIRSKDTQPELAIRREMHRRGYRYRLHARELPGKPDMVFPRFRAVTFIHGCFWHGHSCPLFRLPSTRPEFWRGKIDRNLANDTRASDALLAAGWRVSVIWECALKGRAAEGVATAGDALAAWLEGTARSFELPAATGRTKR
jgi:DNA mismatch endonuclease (patch repair protein)